MMRDDIQGLRAIAVLAVIVNHFYATALPSGFLGVDIFFVISGYVITTSLQSKEYESFGEYIREFYSRRLRRILPALVVCVIISSALICAVNPNPDISLLTGALSLIGVSNIFLWVQSLDYFSPAAKSNIFTQTWSLGVEEQFYLFYPIAIYWLCKKKKFLSSQILPMIMGSCVISLATFLYLQNNSQSTSFYIPIFRFWELGLGCLICFLPGPRLIKNALFINSSLVILVSTFFFEDNFISASTLIVTILTAFIIWYKFEDSKTYKLLSTRLLVHIGAISYSLYLYHWTILVIARWTYGINILTIPYILFFIIFFSYFSYLFIERPFRAKKLQKNNIRNILNWLIVIIITIFIVFIFYKIKSNIFGLKNNDNNIISTQKLILNKDGSTTTSSDSSGLAADELPDNQLRNLNHTTPIINSLSNEEMKANDSKSGLDLSNKSLLTDYGKCVVDVNGGTRHYENDTFDRCTIPPKITNGRMIWMLGDSHAGQYLGLLKLLYEKKGYGIHLIETPGLAFPMPKNYTFNPRQDIIKNIKQKARPGDVLVIGRIYLNRGNMAPMSDLDLWGLEVEKFAEELKPLKIKIILIAPIPMFEFLDINICKNQALDNAQCTVDRTRLAAPIYLTQMVLDELAVKKDNIFIFKPFDILCPPTQSKCYPYINGNWVYRDADHLSPEAGYFLYEPFMKLLQSIN